MNPKQIILALLIGCLSLVIGMDFSHPFTCLRNCDAKSWDGVKEHKKCNEHID